MAKVILVPVDVAQEEAAANALSVAKDLAQNDGDRLVLLNVVDLPAYVAGQIPQEVQKQFVASAEETLTRIAADHGVGERSDVRVHVGHPSNTILEVAAGIKADTIVLASHDPNITDYLLGSVAGRVVRHAHCSVFVVRSPN